MTTHTYAILDVSEFAYAEIRAKLEAAGYAHAFHYDEDENPPEVIDMHGIALRASTVSSGSTQDHLMVLRALVAAIDACDEPLAALCGFAAIHGWQWPADKNWRQELADAKALLDFALTKQSRG